MTILNALFNINEYELVDATRIHEVSDNHQGMYSYFCHKKIL